jgi:hypothetical protein
VPSRARFVAVGGSDVGVGDELAPPALALTVLPLLVAVALGVLTLVLLFRWVTG